VKEELANMIIAGTLEPALEARIGEALEVLSSGTYSYTANAPASAAALAREWLQEEERRSKSLVAVHGISGW
jgi:hypothetical protein